MTLQHHESQPQAIEVPRASNRSVGIVLAVLFGVIGAWPMLSNELPRIWALGLAAGLMAFAIVWPRALAPVAWFWLGLGKVLHVVVSPIVLGLMYIVAVIPTGLYVRLSGKDPLRLKRDSEASSYWIRRDPPGPDSQSLRQQF